MMHNNPIQNFMKSNQYQMFARQHNLPQEGTNQKEKIDPYNYEVHYNELQNDYDFDPNDRPTVYPSNTYAKNIYPANKTIEQSVDNFYDPDYTSAVCSSFLGQCQNKHNKPLYQLKWKKDGKQVVTTSGSGQIIVWDADHLQFNTSCDVHDQRVQAIAWSNYHKYLVTGDKHGFVVYCNNKLVIKNRFRAHNDTCIRDLSFSMSSVKFVTCSDHGTARVWDFATSKQEMEFKEHGSNVITCDWHPFQSLIVTGSKDLSMRIWDPRNGAGKSIFELRPHATIIQQTKWNPINGHYILTGSKDKKIKLFDIRMMPNQVREFEGHNDAILCIQWHPFKEEIFASSCEAGQITFWKSSCANKLHDIQKAHFKNIYSIDWHPTGTKLASAGTDQKVRFWGLCKPYEEPVQPPVQQMQY